MARRNERGLELTFDKKGKRWKKIIDGKAVYFGRGNGVSDRESYKAALKQYRIFVAQRNLGVASAERRYAAYQGKELPPFPGKELMAMVDAKAGEGAFQKMAQRGIIESFNKLMAELAEFRQMFPNIAMPTLATQGTLVVLPDANTTGATTYGEMLDVFLTFQQGRREKRKFIEAQKEQGKKIDETSGQGLSADRIRTIEDYSAKLKDHFGDRAFDGSEKSATAFLEEWKRESETLLHSGKIGVNSYNERMKIASQFVEWLHTNLHLPALPRNKKALCAKIQYKATAKAIPVETIRQLWSVADDREKAWIALALGAGFYAKDISDLRHTEIIDGFIVRERSKTGVKVCHKLWAITADLIAKASNSDNRVFVGKNGETLVHHDSKHRVDLVARAWTSLCRRAGVKGYAFSNLRDTSATLVEKKFPALTDKFLSHVDNRIATLYIDNSGIDHRLDEVVDYLDTMYDLK